MMSLFKVSIIKSTLSNMRSKNPVKFKIFFRVGNIIIVNTDADCAIIRKLNNRWTFVFKQWPCTTKNLDIS